MAGDDKDRTGMVQRELSQDEWEKRAEKLANEEALRIAVQKKKRTHNRLWNEELIQLRESIEQLTEEVETRKAWVPAQTDMFGDDEPDPDPEPEEKPRGRRGRRSAANVNGSAVDAA